MPTEEENATYFAWLAEIDMSESLEDLNIIRNTLGIYWQEQVPGALLVKLPAEYVVALVGAMKEKGITIIRRNRP
jgi:hypothetical protein